MELDGVSVWDILKRLARLEGTSVFAFGNRIEFVPRADSVPFSLLPLAFGKQRGFKLYREDESPMGEILRQGDKGEDLLLRYLDSDDGSVRANCAVALAAVGGKAALRQLLDVTSFDDQSEKHRLWFAAERIVARNSEDGEIADIVVNEVLHAEGSRLERLMDIAAGMDVEHLSVLLPKLLEKTKEPRIRAKALTILLRRGQLSKEQAGEAMELLGAPELPVGYRRALAASLAKLGPGYDDQLYALWGKVRDTQILQGIVRGITPQARKECWIAILSNHRVVRQLRRSGRNIDVRLCDIAYMRLQVPFELKPMNLFDDVKTRDAQISSLRQRFSN